MIKNFYKSMYTKYIHINTSNNINLWILEQEYHSKVEIVRIKYAWNNKKKGGEVIITVLKRS